MAKYYAKKLDLLRISRGYLNFEIDPVTREIVGLKEYPALAKTLVDSGLVTTRKPRSVSTSSSEDD